MAGPFIPFWSLSRSQSVRLGNAQGGVVGLGSGGRIVPQLAQNPSTNPLPAPLLADLSDPTTRRDLAHHMAVGNLVPATPLRLTNSVAANSAAIAATPTLIGNIALPINVLNVGSSVRVTVQGVTSATGNVIPVVKLGTAGTTADTTILTQTVAGATGGGGFVYDALLTVQAVGAGTAGKLMGNAQFSGHGASPSLTSGTTPANIDTTVAEFVDFVISVSAGTVTVTNCVFEFIDAQF